MIEIARAHQPRCAAMTTRRCNSSESERINSAKYRQSGACSQISSANTGTPRRFEGMRCPGIVDFLGERLIPDVTETQQIGPRRIGHAALQIVDEFASRHRHRAVELRGEKQQCRRRECRATPTLAFGRLTPCTQIITQHHDDRDGRHIHQKMNVMDQNQDHREPALRKHHEGDRTRRHQQQARSRTRSRRYRNARACA